MMHKTATLILALAAIFFMGYGITGFVVIDSGSMCTEDLDCQYSECCPLFEQDYGVCAVQTQCDEIYFSSMEDETIFRAPDVGSEIERNYIAVALGVIMLMILLIVGYFEWKHEKANKRVKKRAKK